MNRREFLVVGPLGMAGAGLALQTTTVPRGLTAVQERKRMPPFALPDTDGKIVQSGAFTGNVLKLRFWATW
jgi:hypothetical protein